MVRQTRTKVAGRPAKKSTVGKVATAVGRVASAAKNIKNAVEDEIIPEIVDSARAIQNISTDSSSNYAATGYTAGYASRGAVGASGLPDPNSLEIRGLDRIAPLLNVDPFDAASFAAAGHTEMSKPEYEATKAQLEGYNRKIETVQLGMQVLKNTLKLAASGAEVATAKIDYAIKYQGIETKSIELEIAQSGTRQTQSKLDKEMQKEQFLEGENVISGQMLNMKLKKLSLLAQQQSADLLQTQRQTQAMIGNAEG